MNTVVCGEKNGYPIIVGKDILCSEAVFSQKDLPGDACMLVSDDNVYPILGERVRAHIAAMGKKVFTFVFPHGEESKNASTLASLLEKAAESGLCRSDAFLALGGGVTGDLTGLASALYMRGIDVIHIPTSLLAMTDSSVGGKTAVDLAAGKNLMGAFHRPKKVICDISLLSTLPEEYFSDGMAEVIKYGMIYDEKLFSALSDRDFDRKKVIAKCVSLKAECVARDEFDVGERMKLNFGHTLGHAIERFSGYKIPHGSAVAVGMAVVTRAAERNGICEKGSASRLEELLRAYSLPTECRFDLDSLLGIMQRDKKRSGEKYSLIVPERVGSVKIVSKSGRELAELLKTGI